MKLYLVRHGHYLSHDMSLNHPLSPQGEADIKQVARHLKKINLRVPTIVHSTKLRAQQTAHILADAINDGQCDELAGLQPDDPTQQMVKLIHAHNENLMIVGHLPYLGKLTSQLLVHDEELELVEFTPGTVVCLNNKGGVWSLQWVITPLLCS